MIDCLYDFAKEWCKKGSIYIISDTHFNDSDCKLMDSNWITPQEHIDKLKKTLNKNDTLICLGDCGDLEFFNQLKCYKVLIKGNHDDKAKILYWDFFDEIYEGPLFIAPKILLSHEPIFLNCCLNIHGHCHRGSAGYYYNELGGMNINLASNITNWNIYNLGKEIKKGCLSKINDIHRITINKATEKGMEKWN